MSMGDRILQRLTALGMSQAELARRVGVTQPTINGLIRGGARSSAHLHKIARVLQTTPAFLSEETDDDSADISEFDLSATEHEWVELLRALSPKDRSAVMQIVRSIATSAASPKIHDNQLTYRGEA